MKLPTFLRRALLRRVSGGVLLIAAAAPIHAQVVLEPVTPGSQQYPIAITNLPGPASNPGVAPPMPQAAVFFTILAIIVPSLFVSFGLVLYGMRGAATEG